MKNINSVVCDSTALAIGLSSIEQSFLDICYLYL